MGPQNMPAAEVEITVGLVRSLLADQQPDLVDLPLWALANGWDNVIYRLGDEYTVRLPRRDMAAVLVEHEQRWLPDLAHRLPIAIPAPVRVGGPGHGYPWKWSIIPWLDGEIAAIASLSDPTAEARRLGEFMAALHVPAPVEAPPNPYRGHFIGANSAVFLDRLGQVEADVDALVEGGVEHVRRRWAELTDVAAHAGPPMWIHGDVHAANLLVDRGAMTAVIDFGDITAGDPATDLAIAWMLFDEPDRAVFRRAAGSGESDVDDATWQRGEAWALHFAVMYLAHSADSPTMSAIGERLLPALFAD